MEDTSVDPSVLDLITDYSDGFEDVEEESEEDEPVEVPETPSDEPMRIAPDDSSMEEALASVPKEGVEEEPMRIAPVESDVRDVLRSIPRETPEREMIGPIAEGDRVRMDALRGHRVERLPPVSSSIQDIEAVMEQVAALDRSDAEDDYIRWILRDNIEKGVTEDIEAEEDGGVVIIRQEGSE